MILHSEVIEIGQFTRTHGKEGELQCLMCNELWDDNEGEFLILDIDSILVPFRVDDWRGKGADSLLFTLHGISTEQQALALIGHKVYMLRRDITSRGDGADLMTWQDLVGYRVLTADKELGTIREVDESTINTLAILDNDMMIPLHEDLIEEIKASEHILIMNNRINL